MLQGLCRWLLYKVMGYHTEVTQKRPSKFVIALAPHTSNWDFIIGNLYAFAEGFHCQFMIKSEWFIWPWGYLMRALGGVPIQRSKQLSTTDQLAKIARESDKFQLCVTPEGTRSLNTEWKKGFYYIALKANIPILLYGLDYERKLIVCTKKIIPTGDYEKQLQEVKEFYKDFKGKHPKKFSTGL